MPERPILEDQSNEKEIFASEIAGIGLIHGNVAITLANLRFDEAVGEQTPKPHRVVTGRIILTNPAANQLLQGLQRLATQLEAATKAAAGPPRN